jgi:hypothetical protein
MQVFLCFTESPSLYIHRWLFLFLSIDVRVRAQVMLRDDSTGGWVPMGGGGLSNVSVKKRIIHHDDFTSNARNEYLIYGRRISDNSVCINLNTETYFWNHLKVLILH